MLQNMVIHLFSVFGCLVVIVIVIASKDWRGVVGTSVAGEHLESWGGTAWHCPEPPAQRDHFIPTHTGAQLQCPTVPLVPVLCPENCLLGDL